MTLCLPLLSRTALSQQLYRPPPSAIPGTKQHSNNKPSGGQKRRVTASPSSQKALAFTSFFHLFFSSFCFTETSASVFAEKGKGKQEGRDKHWQTKETSLFSRLEKKPCDLTYFHLKSFSNGRGGHHKKKKK